MSDTMEVFETTPVPKAVLKNAIPAMAAMLMVLIYNLADTFFIGQTHNDILVAAVSLATPVFLIFMAVGTIFGIGASADTWEPAKTYLTIVALGGPFVLISNCYSNILRAEGQPNQAMVGQVLGNLLNVVLDPIMILTLQWGIAGAAIATVIGNVVGAGYYILYYLRGQSSLSIHIRDFSVKDQICANVLSIGIPASLGSLLMSVSQIVVNARMAGYGDMAVAGMGVAMKVTMITGMICIGFGQGVQPLLGYCVGAKLWERFKKIMRFSVLFSLGLSAVMTGLCYLLRDSIIRVFLTDAAYFDYATTFTSILLTTSFLFGVFYVLTNALQAMGAAVQALIINLSRQGIIYIPALFILQAVLEANGLAWAQPVADLLSTALVAALYLWTSRKMMEKRPSTKNLLCARSF